MRRIPTFAHEKRGNRENGSRMCSGSRSLSFHVVHLNDAIMLQSNSIVIICSFQPMNHIVWISRHYATVKDNYYGLGGLLL